MLLDDDDDDDDDGDDDAAGDHDDEHDIASRGLHHQTETLRHSRPVPLASTWTSTTSSSLRSFWCRACLGARAKQSFA